MSRAAHGVMTATAVGKSPVHHKRHAALAVSEAARAAMVHGVVSGTGVIRAVPLMESALRTAAPAASCGAPAEWFKPTQSTQTNPTPFHLLAANICFREGTVGREIAAPISNVPTAPTFTLTPPASVADSFEFGPVGPTKSAQTIASRAKITNVLAARALQEQSPSPQLSGECFVHVSTPLFDGHLFSACFFVARRLLTLGIVHGSECAQANLFFGFFWGVVDQ
jgi:hypothetical protein